MLKPPPPDNLSGEQLKRLREWPIQCRYTNCRTLCILSRVSSPSVVTTRDFTATGRPLNDIRYTREKPPVANGVCRSPSSVSARMNDDGMIPKVPQRFRKHFSRCARV